MKEITILHSGTRAVGQVVAVERWVDGPRVEVTTTLLLTPSRGAPYTLACRTRLPPALAELVQPGALLPVRIEPRQRTQVVLDERLLEQRQAAITAGQAAPPMLREPFDAPDGA